MPMHTRPNRNTHTYQGTRPFSVADEIDKVQMEFVYPSQLQLSCSRPPFPPAHTNKTLNKRVPFTSAIERCINTGANSYARTLTRPDENRAEASAALCDAVDKRASSELARACDHQTQTSTVSTRETYTNASDSHSPSTVFPSSSGPCANIHERNDFMCDIIFDRVRECFGLQ